MSENGRWQPLMHHPSENRWRTPMLNSPFAAYRSRHQQVGPWHLRLITWTVVGLAVGAGYWLFWPMVVLAILAAQ